ncbi:MAG: hypothetical protein HQL76_03410 [Magnetococcales bacterium]|nr:hypothetical protein [Magnetococcales bacterium]
MKMHKGVKRFIFVVSRFVPASFLILLTILSVVLFLMFFQYSWRATFLEWTGIRPPFMIEVKSPWVRLHPLELGSDGVRIFFISGATLNLDRVVIGAGMGILTRWSLEYLRLDRPVLRLPTPVTAMEYAADESREDAREMFFPWPFGIDGVEIVAGEVIQAAIPGKEGWRIHDLSLLGQDLTTEAIEIHFNARADPGGGIHGVVRWRARGDLDVVTHADGAPLAGISRWLGRSGLSGTLVGDLEASRRPGAGLTVKLAGQVSGWGYGRWGGDLKVEAAGDGERLWGRFHGLVRPGPGERFVPLGGRWLAAGVRTGKDWTLNGELDGGALGRLTLTRAAGAWNVGVGPGNGIDLNRVSRFVPGWGTAPGVKGRLQGRLTLRGPETNGSVAFDYRLRVRKGEWSAPKDAAMEGVEAVVRGTGRVSAGGEGHGSLDLSLVSGEWLVGTLYGNLAREEARARLDGVWDGDGVTTVAGEVTGRTGRLHSISWKRGRDGFLLGATLEKGDLGWLSENYFQGFSASAGRGGETAIRVRGLAWGTLSGKFTSRGIPDFSTLKGLIELDEGEVVAGGVRASGVRLRLPLHGADTSVPVTPGMFKVTSLTVGDMALPSIGLAPTWHGGDLRMGGAWTGPFQGGTIRLDRISLSLAGVPGLAMAGMGRDVQFSLPFAANQPVRVDFDFPLIQVLPNGVSLEGTVTAFLFGGVARGSGLGMVWNGPSPEWRADIDFSELDLERLTEATGIGRITGTLSGEILRLRVVGDTPVAFQARVATVPGKTTQTIHVKALENIQILGGGGAAASLNRGIMALFKEYRYRTLGFQCTLKNDMFELSGVRNENGKSWLVEGGWVPPKVDVVSHQRSIPWTEMIDRLRSIGRSDEKPIVR